MYILHTYTTQSAKHTTFNEFHIFNTQCSNNTTPTQPLSQPLSQVPNV